MLQCKRQTVFTQGKKETKSEHVHSLPLQPFLGIEEDFTPSSKSEKYCKSSQTQMGGPLCVKICSSVWPYKAAVSFYAESTSVCFIEIWVSINTVPRPGQPQICAKLYPRCPPPAEARQGWSPNSHGIIQINCFTFKPTLLLTVPTATMQYSRVNKLWGDTAARQVTGLLLLSA